MLAIASNAQDRSNQDILTSLGKPSKWNAINYILFTTSNQSQHFKEHSFLIDKSSGKVRFEGKTINNVKTVLLFNFKTKTTTKSYLNGKLDDSKSPALLQEIYRQLFEDTELLFLPMLIASTQKNNLSVTSSKMINTEKLFEITFKNVYNLNKQPINGTIYLNAKGEVKEYELDHSSFIVNDIKDIGDGILLPTKFTKKNNSNVNIKFDTVAAFTNIEEEKFNSL